MSITPGYLNLLEFFFQKHMINDKSEHMSKTILQIYRYIQRIAQPVEDLTEKLFYFQLAHQIMSCQANESVINMPAKLRALCSQTDSVVMSGRTYHLVVTSAEDHKPY